MFTFARNKKTTDLYPYIRRICDLTTPNFSTKWEGRSEDRFNRTIPTLLCPWHDDRPVLDEVSVCLTSDLADRGVRVVLSQPFHAERVVLGYWIGSDDMCEAWFFLGDVRRNQPIGGGYWAVGIELAEYANTDHKEKLVELKNAAAKLLPPISSGR